MTSDETKNQLLLTMSFLDDNLSTLCRNAASYQISQLSKATWIYRCFICHHDALLRNEGLQRVIQQSLSDFIRLLNQELPPYMRL
jgi:hypothetical protein